MFWGFLRLHLNILAQGGAGPRLRHDLVASDVGRAGVPGGERALRSQRFYGQSMLRRPGFIFRQATLENLVSPGEHGANEV